MNIYKIAVRIMGSRGLAPLQGVLKGGRAAPFFLSLNSYEINYNQWF